MAKKLLVFPFGGSAREALLCIQDINKKKKIWDVLGFIDDNPQKKGMSLYGVKVLGRRDLFAKHKDARILVLPANPESYGEKEGIIKSLNIDPWRYAKVTHPSAVISEDAAIGYNTVIMANVFISCGCKVGNHNIILPNTVISHDCQIDDNCFIGSNVSISGTVKIKKNCFIASGVTIRNHIVIEKDSLVGLAANVVANIKEGVVVMGNPAKENGTK